MIKSRAGVNVLHETRGESDLKIDRNKLYRQILEVLADRQMTAHEIAREMYERKMIPKPERQAVAPRISELLNEKGLLDAVGKKPDFESGKLVGVFERRCE